MHHLTTFDDIIMIVVITETIKRYPLTLSIYIKKRKNAEILCVRWLFIEQLTIITIFSGVRV